MMIIIGGLAPHNSHICAQKYTRYFDNKSVDVCHWILFGARLDIHL